jgi:hypothetical protein
MPKTLCQWSSVVSSKGMTCPPASVVHQDVHPAEPADRLLAQRRDRVLGRDISGHGEGFGAVVCSCLGGGGGRLQVRQDQVVPASFGLSSLLWRHGLGYSGVQAVIPIYIFIFLVALGVDYNIFLSARIREESRRLGLRDGTLRGLGLTGGVITAAGVVLAGTFAALTQIPGVSITEVGTAVALGVLLDTLVVRTILVPASLLTLGERVWWPARSGRGRQGAGPYQDTGRTQPAMPKGTTAS